MRELSIEDRDRDLISMATTLIGHRYRPIRHHVAAVVSSSSGAVYQGVHVGWGRVNVCAEQIALANALAAGESNFVTCVAVMASAPSGMTGVVSPCGTCREMLRFFAPDLKVLIRHEGRVAKTYITDLLPAPWVPLSAGNYPELSKSDNSGDLAT
jgi:cytidine deaminase